MAVSLPATSIRLCTISGLAVVLKISRNSYSGKPTEGTGSAMTSVMIKSPNCGVYGARKMKVTVAGSILLENQSSTPETDNVYSIMSFSFPPKISCTALSPCIVTAEGLPML